MPSTKYIYFQLDYNNLWDSLNIISKGCWKKLRELGLSGNLITGDSLAQLATAEWSNLRIIDLSNNNIDAKGAHFIVESKW